MHTKSFSEPPLHPTLFWVGTVGIALLLLLAVGAITISTERLGRERLPFQTLLLHQQKKMTSPVPSVLFLGDSSLGNAIDAALWSRETGQKALNLALTGIYGYGGPYVLLDQLLAKGDKPDLVILVHTADMMTRPLTHVATTELVPPETYLDQLKRLQRDILNMPQLGEALRFVLRLGWIHPETQIEDDYMVQGPPRPNLPQNNNLLSEYIKPEKVYYLKKIAALCQSKGIQCVYAHGPLAYPLCNSSPDYFDRVNDLITSAGLRVVIPRPPCIFRENAGDNIDHVAPKAKADMTRWYRNKIKLD